ncbi:CotY/CotZ family spore coat protein [Ureibacillus acetophenoni]|uniref:Spore coat protein Z n=1 Tax=Ureibacillus acetophenoni TaxID=614649 RepID=A0A285TZG0_9BACL|nr:CotY/CotZ family spore coat protein [Ureibacillus acetophenoni]SOC35110.1 spore coat protein Z [Ureibacillus acetophenoni]
MGCGRNHDSSSFHGDKHDDRGCICEVVKSILKIQNAAVRHDCDTCGTSCYLEPLGGLSHRSRNADTRVFMLLDELGKPFKVMARRGQSFFHTCFFRVEDVFGDCCATLRALDPIRVPLGDELDEEMSPIDPADAAEDGVVFLDNDNINPVAFSEIRKFKKTDTCCTVDLNDFTAIQCVADCDLNICN